MDLEEVRITVIVMAVVYGFDSETWSTAVSAGVSRCQPVSVMVDILFAINGFALVG